MFEMLKEFLHFFPGLESFMLMNTGTAIARIVLMGTGFALVYLGYRRVLDPLLMVPMGIGISMVNAGILLMPALEPGLSRELGTMFVNPLVSTAREHIEALQVYFLQPIYTLAFANGLIACLVFVGIGAITDLDFFISNPRLSLLLAIPAELGTILTFPISVAMGFTPSESAAIAVIGGGRWANGAFCVFTACQTPVRANNNCSLYLPEHHLCGLPFFNKDAYSQENEGCQHGRFNDEQRVIRREVGVQRYNGNTPMPAFPSGSPAFRIFFLGSCSKRIEPDEAYKGIRQCDFEWRNTLLGFHAWLPAQR